jgi:hypothetical protein
VRADYVLEKLPDVSGPGLVEAGCYTNSYTSPWAPILATVENARKSQLEIHKPFYLYGGTGENYYFRFPYILITTTRVFPSKYTMRGPCNQDFTNFLTQL